MSLSISKERGCIADLAKATSLFDVFLCSICYSSGDSDCKKNFRVHFFISYELVINLTSIYVYIEMTKFFSFPSHAYFHHNDPVCINLLNFILPLRICTKEGCIATESSSYKTCTCRHEMRFHPQKVRLNIKKLEEFKKLEFLKFFKLFRCSV